MELIIDTSSKKMKLLLIDGEKTYSGTEFESNHSEHLLKEIENILLTSGKTLEDVSLVSLVIGPGSFTGIRLSVSTAKALSEVFPNIKFITINKLDLINSKLYKTNIKNNYLVAIYCTSNKSYVLSKISNVVEYKTMLNSDLLTLVERNNATIYCFDSLLNNGLNCKKVELTNEDYIKFVDNKKNAKDFVNVRNIEPIYMAVSQAEEELMKKNKDV